MLYRLRVNSTKTWKMNWRIEVVDGDVDRRVPIDWIISGLENFMGKNVDSGGKAAVDLNMCLVFH